MSDPIQKLQGLTPRGSSGWRDVPATLRRRRGLRAGAAGVVVVAAALAITLPRLGGDPAPPAPVAQQPGLTIGQRVGPAAQLIADTAPAATSPAAETAVAKAEQDFTGAFLRRAVAGHADDNVSVSPASLALALSMLQEGAGGATRDQIAAALQTSGLGSDTQSQGWASLTEDWTAAAKAAGIELSSANSLWAQHGLKLNKPFMAALARYYDSGVWQVDFGSPAATQAINQWTSEHTHGKITKLFDRLDPSTLLVLANAVYFHAAWQTPFDSAETEPGAFAAPSGSTQAQFMTSTKTFAAATGDGYQAAQMPYHGGRFAALAIMPTSGSLGDLVDGLDGARLASIAASLTTQSAVKLPKFTTTSTTDLTPVLQSLGMRSAFTDGADFSPLSPQPLQVTGAVQRVYLQVGEKGTEAAAVTGIAMAPSSVSIAPSTMTFDHPFLFLIRDVKTGAVLFASQIANPGA